MGRGIFTGIYLAMWWLTIHNLGLRWYNYHCAVFATVSDNYFLEVSSTFKYARPRVWSLEWLFDAVSEQGSELPAVDTTGIPAVWRCRSTRLRPNQGGI